jgi:4-hydroxybenzoate polyprenyltransferase
MRKGVNLNKMRNLFFAFRPKQWVKNLFIFLPLIFGGKIFIYPVNLKTAVAFFLFSLMASAVYLINDIMDLQKDRLHPAKRLRPIAAGKVSIKQAQVSVCILGVLSAIFSFSLNIYFGWIVTGYFVFNLIYTRMLKNIVIIDVFCIGGFFLLRIIAGGVIAGIELTSWIIFMIVFLALFLGFTKRRQELRLLKRKAVSGRFVLSKYNITFIDQMIAVLTSSIVVAYMLYTVDAKTINRFGSNHLIYSIPFVYYGIFRYLYLIYKRNRSADPTEILLSDSMMQLNLALWIIACITVIYFGL